MNTAASTDWWTVITIIGMALVTVVTRSFFFISSKRWSLPAWAERGLHYAPIAALAAVIIPEMVMTQGQLIGSIKDARGNIGATAGTKADNNVDRLVIGPFGRRGRGEHRKGRRKDRAFHNVLPFYLSHAPPPRGALVIFRLRFHCAARPRPRPRSRRCRRPSSRPDRACARDRRRTVCR